jgi:hypothetical protein
MVSHNLCCYDYQSVQKKNVISWSGLVIEQRIFRFVSTPAEAPTA